MINDFMECASCKSKPGTPPLCISCLHNREIIEQLDNSVKWHENQQILDQQIIHDKDREIVHLQRELGETRVKLADAMDKYIDLLKEKSDRLEKESLKLGGEKSKVCETCKGLGVIYTQQGFFSTQQHCPDCKEIKNKKSD